MAALSTGNRGGAVMGTHVTANPGRTHALFVPRPGGWTMRSEWQNARYISLRGQREPTRLIPGMGIGRSDSRCGGMRRGFLRVVKQRRVGTVFSRIVECHIARDANLEVLYVRNT